MVRESSDDTADANERLADAPVLPSQCRDLSAFEHLVRSYQPYAYALAMKFLCDEQEAADVVQETFIRIWNNLHRYDPNRKFTTWMYAIVSNLCVDRFRVLRRTRWLFRSEDSDQLFDDLPDERNWESLHSQQELAAIIRTLAGRLSRAQRLVFTLRDLHDLPVDEVVTITGMSAGSVKTNLHYARKTIRNILIRQYGVKREDI